MESTRTALRGKSKAAVSFVKAGPIAEGRNAKDDDDTAKLKLGPDSAAVEDENPFQTVNLNDPYGTSI